MESYLHVLGCGDAFASGGRANTSFLLNYNGKIILLDCGATTLTRLKSNGYKTSQISGIVLTHFHGDHFGGIPALILDREFGEGKSVDLFIASPNEGKERITSLMECTYPGTSNLLEGQNIRFHYYEDLEELNLSEFTIKGLPVIHAPQTRPHAIRISFGEYVVAFSGDSMWTDNLIEISKNADILLIDCNFMEPGKAGHLDYQTLSKNLNKFQVGKVLLTHMGEEVINSGEIKLERIQDSQKILLSK